VISVDAIVTSGSHQPAVMFSFDDARATGYSVAFDYMSKCGLRGTQYAKTGSVDGAGYYTWNEARIMDAAGWCIANHSDTATNLDSMSEADQETHLTTAKTSLESNGLTRASKHVAYPGGSWNADTLTAMTNLGMLTGRTILESWFLMYGMDNQRILSRALATSAPTVTLATAKGYIDSIKSRQAVLTLYIHDLIDSPASIDWTPADFRSLVDYVVQQGIPCITIDDLYKLQSGPVSIPRPHGW
jgi:peptidoglycan/xylan/chitin deacetylase (PgdA/CDA1 family)